MPSYIERIRDIVDRQDDFAGSIVAEYLRQLKPMAQRATGRLLVTLEAELGIESGAILQNATNQRLIRQIERLLMEYLDDLGYFDLNTAFVSQFEGQAVFFQDTLRLLAESIKSPIRLPSFGITDLKPLQGIKLSVATNLESVMRIVAQTVTQRAAFSIGGLRYTDLVRMISDQTGVSIVKSETIASTGTATYYRQLSDKGFEKIEKAVGVLRYSYLGPKDKLNRPFCSRMVEKSRNGETWTREELAAMDNGNSLGNVLLSGGGWNCRHQIAVALKNGDFVQ